MSQALIERLTAPESAPLLVALAAVVVGLVALILVLVRTGGRRDPRLDHLAGRLGQLAENQAVTANLVTERLQAQEREVTRALQEGLRKSADRQAMTMQDLRARLATIDAAQKTLTDLSQKMAGLEDILSNKQARGALGQTQMEDLVREILPPNAYRFQGKLGNGRIADCLLDLPNPPGLIAIDAKYPLESFRAFRDAREDEARQRAGKTFAADVLKHVKDIAEKYIIAEETADSALMFLPAEAVYAELHASFPQVVEEAFRRRVWIVSPTTLMATLNTLRAILKDARMNEVAGLIRKEVRTLIEDVGRLDDRVGNLARHFGQATEDIRQIQISTEKIVRRGDRIEEVEFGGVEDNTNGTGLPIAAPKE